MSTYTELEQCAMDAKYKRMIAKSRQCRLNAMSDAHRMSLIWQQTLAMIPAKENQSNDRPA